MLLESARVSKRTELNSRSSTHLHKRKRFYASFLYVFYLFRVIKTAMELKWDDENAANSEQIVQRYVLIKLKINLYFSLIQSCVDKKEFLKSNVTVIDNRGDNSNSKGKRQKQPDSNVEDQVENSKYSRS